MKTGRIWVESEWEWVPETLAVGSVLPFPIVPVVDVKLYDLTDPKDIENDNPGDNEGNDGIDDAGNSGSEGDNVESGNQRRRRLAREAARKKRDGETDTAPTNPERPDKPQEPENPEISAEFLSVEYPSLDPMGYPAIGTATILKTLPDKFRLVLTVGYPVESKTEVIEQYDNPVLVLDKTGFSENIIRLVFNRPVEGDIYIDNFEVRKKAQDQESEIPEEDRDSPSDTDNARRKTMARKRIAKSALSILDNDVGEDGTISPPEITVPADPKDILITIEDVYFMDGAIEIQYQEGAISEGDHIQVSFFEGAAYDQFENFVQPIILQDLPLVSFANPDDFAIPDPVPEKEVYVSLAPDPIKNWILTRVGSLYSQRTEIALRAGKSNDAMFPDQFINNLLDPYRVRFLSHVR